MLYTLHLLKKSLAFVINIDTETKLFSSADDITHHAVIHHRPENANKHRVFSLSFAPISCKLVAFLKNF